MSKQPFSSLRLTRPITQFSFLESKSMPVSVSQPGKQDNTRFTRNVTLWQLLSSTLRAFIRQHDNIRVESPPQKVFLCSTVLSPCDHFRCYSVESLVNNLASTVFPWNAFFRFPKTSGCFPPETTMRFLTYTGKSYSYQFLVSTLKTITTATSTKLSTLFRVIHTIISHFLAFAFLLLSWIFLPHFSDFPLRSDCCRVQWISTRLYSVRINRMSPSDAVYLGRPCNSLF